MGKTETTRAMNIPVEGMDCSDCVLVLEHALGRIEGVRSATASYTAQSVRVEYDARRASRGAIERRIRSLGYDVPATGLRAGVQDNRELLLSLLAGLFLALGWLGERFLLWPPSAYLALYLASYFAAGWHVARHAWHALRERTFDTDLLMLAAALGAAALGEFAEGALLLCLFSLGHALEESALDRARDAVRSLANLAPRTALVRRNDTERELPIEEISVGDMVIVRPGARIPVDGEVVSGVSSVNQAPVTGESVPVDVAAGSRVFAGTVNGEGALEVQTTRLARDSTLARVMRMVEEAQAQKSPTQHTVERVMRIFVPAVLIGAGLLIVVPPLLIGMPWRESFLRAMTLLVAASPCALALGAPVAVLAGVARAAQGGVLVKGGAHLENLGRLRAIAFDKTGTVTVGRPTVVGAYSLDGGPPEEWMALAGAAESRSGHPLARAISAAGGDARNLLTVDQATTVSGLGVRATVAGQEVFVGSLRYLAESGIAVSESARVAALEAGGATVAAVAAGGRPLGLLALADTLRADASDVVQSLKALGIEETVLLTGDNERAARRIANQARVDSYQANLLPADKVRAITGLVERFTYAGMVGDGVNDAPALAHATVGIAMGAAGTDVALEVADVALMGDDLAALPFAVGLGRATRAVILQNLVIALGVIALLVGAALTGAAGIGATVLFHEGSTLLVVLNGVRLLRHPAQRRTSP
jgi:Cd2+/Zn2+-exporting ATPase